MSRTIFITSVNSETPAGTKRRTVLRHDVSGGPLYEVVIFLAGKEVARAKSPVMTSAIDSAEHQYILWCKDKKG